MPYCHKCGAQLPEGTQFCHKCGAERPELPDPAPQEESAPAQGGATARSEADPVTAAELISEEAAAKAASAAEPGPSPVSAPEQEVQPPAEAAPAPEQDAPDAPNDAAAEEDPAQLEQTPPADPLKWAVPGYGDNLPQKPRPAAPGPMEKGQPQEHGMKWFAFLTYFQLFWRAGWNVIYALSAWGYTRALDLRWMCTPAQKFWGIAYGIVMILLAVAAIWVRQRLVHYRRGAIENYITFRAVNFGVMLAFPLIMKAGGMYDVTNFDPIIDSAIAVVMLAVNTVYLRKREDLFTE